MPKLIPATEADLEELESQLRARARAALGHEPGVRWYNNPQVRGMICKVQRSGLSKPFMAAAGLVVGASDWIGHVTIGPETLRALADAGRSVAMFAALEWKVPGEHPTPEQVTFIDAIRSAGGFATWVDNIEDARAAMVRARRGENQ